MLKPFNTIIFDFDGVILNSMDIKGNGLRKVFNKYPKEKVEALVEFHHENGGLSRYVKIRHFFEEILGEDVREDQVKKYAEAFSKQMKVELDNAKYLIEDSVNYIRDHHRAFHLHIASGADEKELHYICDRLGLSKYFKTIEGSPTPKELLVEGIMKSYGYNKESTVLIGDSKNDYEAAKANGIKFAGYNNEGLRNYEDFYIESFQPLKTYNAKKNGEDELTIRPITLEDEEDFQALITVLNAGDDLGYAVDPQWYRKVLEDGEHIILVAHYLGELVGVFTGMINTQDSAAMNLNVAIHPKVRRRGLGTMLYKEGIKRAKEKNIQKLEAYGKSRIPGGVRFLEKQGFSIGIYSWEMERALQAETEETLQKVDHPQAAKENRVLREVTKVTPGEEKKYHRLLKDCFDDNSTEGALAEVLKDPSIRLWFLERGKDRPQLLGGLAVQLKETTKTAYLFDIGIRPNYRGKGLGVWMLEEVLRRLAARGYKQASLLVAGENEKAMALYKKAGFTVKDEEIVFYKTLD